MCKVGIYPPLASGLLQGTDHGFEDLVNLELGPTEPILDKDSDVIQEADFTRI